MSWKSLPKKLPWKKFYHAIVVDNSLREPGLLKRHFRLLSSKKGEEWTMSKLEVSERELESLIEEIQDNLISDHWYCHLYNWDGSKLIVIFKNAVFRCTANPNSWTPALAHGMDMDIPTEQLDFEPHRFTDEDF